MTMFDRLSAFLEARRNDIYPEEGSDLHVQITAQVVELLASQNELRAGQRVLDVGCGQGPALAEFKKRGIEATGITLGDDVGVCRDKGFDVLEMDLSDLAFDDASFDFIWCRHALEHSVFPMFTLSEFRRLLAPEGAIYVEVPAPDTVARHEENPNHYSVMGKVMWESLFARSGFEQAWVQDINIPLTIGPDVYWGFLLRRAA
jgi:SAM-dependent methyltransferase